MLKHKFKSIDGAIRRLRHVEKMADRLLEITRELRYERNLLAKLSANGAAFNNVLEVVEAKDIRDNVLREIGMNPDGSFRK